MAEPQWSDKQIQFCTAMVAYAQKPMYQRINHGVSYANVGLQAVLLGAAWTGHVSVLMHVVLFVLAFAVADFVNGMVHLYMDHNDHYASRVGPFIAAFHLHHDTPRYQDKPIWRVYLDESGYKIWLFFVLALTLVVFLMGMLSPWLLCFLAYFGVLSSAAEVSHFLCHNSNAPVVMALQRFWLVLPRKHHMLHHRLDNVNYAFLNGMSDPLINLFASRFCRGYRETTDLHSTLYQSTLNAD
ncbi:hypothetical protein DTO96_100442 [Ephemeroptericola cinctiostellae]|uniref:Lipid desaturase domain-containing protein n=1 Tax=Ephemeroptericola cinctiostellae TaxID=2268024 RepID=A0A345D8P4_9BURK|nr:fatty acid desaturase CarF family protein [Ephemeroptericola cinctiostellae]AXF84732.1 hypothetical protein DTO96_100442 [Ephemeroptericola cinctiostellae]